MVETSSQMDRMNPEEQVLEFKAKRLCDIRRYEKKTLVCPSGCGAELALGDIPGHDCIKDLKYRLQIMEMKLHSKDDNANDVSGLEVPHYRRELLAQESKMEQMSAEIRKLLDERSRQDEIFDSKEVFYKEQVAVLREQVVKMERTLRVLRAPDSSANQDDVFTEEEEEESGREAREWIFKYEQLLSDKIGLEKLFHNREREYQREITTLRAETSMLQQNLHLERKILSLEHDRAACHKLESLTDQLEELVKQKQHDQRGKRAADGGTKNGRVRHRIPNSVGSWTSDITEIDEDDAAAQMNS